MSAYAKSENIVSRKISGETVIVPIRSGVGELDSVFALNELGTRIWQLLDGQTRLDQIVDVIVSEYDVSQEQASHDVLEFLSSLEGANLIMPVA